MFYRRREAFNKQHIALFKFGLISCLDALEEFNMIHLITACRSTRGLPCSLNNGKLSTKKTQLLLYLAVESALHTPKSETSCCVSYFYFALAKQFISFIDMAKLLLFRDYFFARLLFPERGPWHQSDSQLIQTERFWRKFTHEGLPSSEYLILKSGLIWIESMWTLQAWQNQNSC